jgi:hypothetical protein
MRIRSSILAGLVATGLVLAGATSALAQELYTTVEDFTGWSDNSGGIYFTPTPTSAFSTDTGASASINGLGNPSNAGGAGTSGSITETRVGGGNYNYFYSQGASSAAFLAALGTSNNGGAGYTASSGVIEFDYVPPTGAGTYFQLGIVLNYNSNFGQFFGGAPVNNGTYFTQDVPYTISSTTSANYFQLGLIWNSDYPNGSTITVDNIHVVPEPASLALLGFGGLGLIGAAIRRRRS